MFTQLIPFLIAYFIYTFTRDLIQFEGPFGWAQWIMLALDILFVLLLIPTSKRAVAAHRQSKEERAAQLEEEQKKLDRQRRAKYYEDFGDGPGYDELRAEEAPDGGEDEETEDAQPEDDGSEGEQPDDPPQ